MITYVYDNLSQAMLAKGVSVVFAVILNFARISHYSEDMSRSSDNANRKR